jgi:hypothetical protein
MKKQSSQGIYSILNPDKHYDNVSVSKENVSNYKGRGKEWKEAKVNISEVQCNLTFFPSIEQPAKSQRIPTKIS